jgi:hypothetical protein
MRHHNCLSDATQCHWHSAQEAALWNGVKMHQTMDHNSFSHARGTHEDCAVACVAVPQVLSLSSHCPLFFVPDLQDVLKSAVGRLRCDTHTECVMGCVTILAFLIILYVTAIGTYKVSQLNSQVDASFLLACGLLPGAVFHIGVPGDQPSRSAILANVTSQHRSTWSRWQNCNNGWICFFLSFCLRLRRCGLPQIVLRLLLMTGIFSFLQFVTSCNSAGVGRKWPQYQVDSVWPH